MIVLNKDFAVGALLVDYSVNGDIIVVFIQNLFDVHISVIDDYFILVDSFECRLAKHAFYNKKLKTSTKCLLKSLSLESNKVELWFRQ